MKKLHLAIMLLSLLATACQPTAQLEKDSTPPAKSGEPTAEKQAANPVSQIPPSNVPEPQKSAEQTTPAKTKIEAQEIKKEYRMNKNYDIVPKDSDGNKKVILLTFDDGPKEKKLLDQMLGVLDKHKAKAIFFVNGYRVKQNPDLLKLIHERGQIIGNHSWDHIDLKKESHVKIEKQVRDVQDKVKEVTGITPTFFRPPFGSGNDDLRELVKQEKMLYMTWSNGSEDWVEKYQNPEGLTKRVMDQLHPGSNILMHELPWTAEALDGLLTKLEEKGYTFVDPRAIDTEI